jgi:hypothetical protein
MFFKPARLEVFYEQLEQLGEDEVRKLIAQGAFAGAAYALPSGAINIL